MTTTQEPKYEIIDGKLCNRQTGQPLPEDEPLFIMRARDRHAADTIAHYFRRLEDDEHREAVAIRLAQFNRFAAEHPDRMHEPDTTVTGDWKP